MTAVFCVSSTGEQKSLRNGQYVTVQAIVFVLTFLKNTLYPPLPTPTAVWHRYDLKQRQKE